MTSPPDSSDFVDNPLRIRCIEVVEVVTHYLERALDDRDHQAVETHLAGCENCTIYVSQIQVTIQLAASAQPSESARPPANMVELSALIGRRKPDH